MTTRIQTLMAMAALGIWLVGCGGKNPEQEIAAPITNHVSEPQTLIIRNAFNQAIKVGAILQTQEMAAGANRNVAFVVVTQTPVNSETQKPGGPTTNDFMESMEPKLVAPRPFGGQLKVLKPDGESEVVELSLANCTPDWSARPARPATFTIEVPQDFGAAVQLCPR
jgi:hypothetical protein